MRRSLPHTKIKAPNRGKKTPAPNRGRTVRQGQLETRRHKISMADKSPQKPEEIGALPMGQQIKTVAPPLKPFKTGFPMANPPSPSFRPEIPRKVVGIPNPTRLQAERMEPLGDEDGKRLVVGRAISVVGDISACETWWYRARSKPT